MRYAVLARYGDTFRVDSDHPTHAEAHKRLGWLRANRSQLTDSCVVGMEARIAPGMESRLARARARAAGGSISAAKAGVRA